MSIVDNRKAFPRLLHRGALRGGDRARGLGGEGYPRGARDDRRGLCHGARREIFLIGANISPRYGVDACPARSDRTRKLLLRAEEIKRLIGKVEQRGYTLVPLNLHYSKGRIKLEVGLGRGKLKHDKRAVEREREWNREKQRLYGR